MAPKEIFGDFPPEGPRVAPGSYRVRVTLGTTRLEDSFDILPHPKLGTIEVRVPGSPLPDEIVFILVMSTGARVHSRVGGLKAADIAQWNGLR